MIEGAATAIAEVTGERPMACPWWAIEEPIVREVMAVHSAMTHDVAAFSLDMEALPARVGEGLRVFTVALARARNELAARKRQKGGDDG